ncbi:MAG: hypothetical protein GX550_08985, partial [Syntrophomonadaceae bacterium]|nr:hypothetical protein [Syntrophomonadaceae bacterium]
DKNILYIEKTRGSLYAAAFETGAHMAGKKDDLINLYKQLGYSLGMCLELINEEESIVEAQLCIQRSKNLLRKLNHENNVVNSTLEKGITELYNLLFKEDKEAAVM